MYLYIDRACLCANNMYNVANFHIRNLMTGLKKEVSLRTENERSVIGTFAVSIPVINFSLRLKHFVKIFRIFLDRSLSADTRRTKLSRVKYLQFSMPSAEKWFASYGLLDAVFRHTENTDYRSFHSHVIQNAINDCCEAWKGYFESRKAYTDSSGHTGKPRIPGYRKSGGRSTAVFSNLACSIKSGRLFFPYAVVEEGKKRVRHSLDVSRLPHTPLLKKGRRGCVPALMYRGSRMLQRQDAGQERNSSRCGQSRTLDHTRSRSSRMTASRKTTCSRRKRISSVLTGTLPGS